MALLPDVAAAAPFMLPSGASDRPGTAGAASRTDAAGRSAFESRFASALGTLFAPATTGPDPSPAGPKAGRKVDRLPDERPRDRRKDTGQAPAGVVLGPSFPIAHAAREAAPRARPVQVGPGDQAERPASRTDRTGERAPARSRPDARQGEGTAAAADEPGKDGTAGTATADADTGAGTGSADASATASTPPEATGADAKAASGAAAPTAGAGEGVEIPTAAMAEAIEAQTVLAQAIEATASAAIGSAAENGGQAAVTQEAGHVDRARRSAGERDRTFQALEAGGFHLTADEDGQGAVTGAAQASFSEAGQGGFGEQSDAPARKVHPGPDGGAPVTATPVGAVPPEQGSWRAAEVTAAAAAAVPDPDTPDRLVQSLRLQFQRGGGEAILQLRPEHLGSVTVALKVDQGVVSARIVAGDPVVAAWLEANEDTLREGLLSSGLSLDRLIIDRDGEAPDRRDRRDAPARPRFRAAADRDSTFELTI